MIYDIVKMKNWSWPIMVLVLIMVFTSCRIMGSPELPIAPEPTETGDSLSPDTVWTWGLNANKSFWTMILGINPGNRLATPAHAKGIQDVKAIAAGASYSMVLKNDGTVWEWKGSNTDYAFPKQVLGLDHITAIASGFGHHLALGSQGEVWTWGGLNNYGEIGNNTTERLRSPTLAIGLPKIVAITGADQKSMALANDGTVWIWGRKYKNDASLHEAWDLVPNQVPGLDNVVAISAGDFHNLALKSDGTVWAWGGNTVGQLGSGTDKSSDTPIRVNGLLGIVAIASGPNHNLALRSDGTVWFWGHLTVHPCEKTQRVPEQVAGLSQILAIAAGSNHSLALKPDGTVWAWGNNHAAQLGDGTTIDRITPVFVRKLTGVKAIACGSLHNMALK
jgi:alpha-tubulin suppressor-like RCC1 family protein